MVMAFVQGYLIVFIVFAVISSIFGSGESSGATAMRKANEAEAIRVRTMEAENRRRAEAPPYLLKDELARLIEAAG